MKKAIQKITERGMLLVFPIQNKSEPPSLWSEFYPRSQMRWEWDSGGDGRVADLWHLREELSRSRKVIYAKWFRGRATFFSPPVFSACLKFLGGLERVSLGTEARSLLRLLEENSPLSTKELKKLSRLQGRSLEGTYQKALTELWGRLLIVGFGEVDDGAFPSLAIGATDVMFEECVAEARKLDFKKAESLLEKKLGWDSLFLKQLWKMKFKFDKQPAAAPVAKIIYGKDL